MEPISLNKIKGRETEAYKASVAIDRILHYETEGNYRQWQFEEYKVNVASLKTTYDELFILWKEEARFRPGFKVQEDSISISNIFSKVSGTHKELDLYFKELESLLKDDTRTIFTTVPFVINKKTTTFDRSILNGDGFFNLNRVKSLNNYPFSHLKTSAQNLILSKVNELLENNDLFNFSVTEEMKFKILNTILSLDEKYLRLIQTFDYPFHTPKIVIFDHNKNLFGKEDSVVLAFLHLIGFDIVVFTPTGYNNLEKYITDTYFHTHRLEEIKYDLKLPRKDNQRINQYRRKRVTTGLLAIFFGGLGGHKFYLGRPIQGIMMLLFCWTLIPSIIGIVQGIGYLKSNDEAFFMEVKGTKRVTAGLLAIFFGGFGIHKFYLGKVLQGLLHIIFSFTLIPFIIGIMEGLKYLRATDAEFNVQYR